MNETKPYQSAGLRDPWQGQHQISDPIRKPAISVALEQLEKQLSELGEQWGRCAAKISTVVSPLPTCPPNECCEKAPEECGPTLALRISKISRTAKNICDSIQETTNQIEL